MVLIVKIKQIKLAFGLALFGRFSCLLVLYLCLDENKPPTKLNLLFSVIPLFLEVFCFSKHMYNTFLESSET